jgi:hypothetical protein
VHRGQGYADAPRSCGRAAARRGRRRLLPVRDAGRAPAQKRHRRARACADGVDAADIEVAVYPDSDKIGVSTRPIGEGAPLRMLVQGTPDVGYYDGEE